MNKITFFSALFMCFVICISFALAKTPFYEKAIKSQSTMEINDKREDFKNPIVLINNNSYVPIREFCEKINANIAWDKTANLIKINTTPDYDPNNIELKETTKGKLYNGRQFVCYDTKTSGLEFKQFQEEHGLKFLKSYQLNNPITSPKLVAEIAQIYFDMSDDVDTTLAGINIHFDKKASLWVVDIDCFCPGGYTALTINSQNGEIIVYSDFAK